MSSCNVWKSRSIYISQGRAREIVFPDMGTSVTRTCVRCNMTRNFQWHHSWPHNYDLEFEFCYFWKLMETASYSTWKKNVKLAINEYYHLETKKIYILWHVLWLPQNWTVPLTNIFPCDLCSLLPSLLLSSFVYDIHACVCACSRVRGFVCEPVSWRLGSGAFVNCSSF